MRKKPLFAFLSLAASVVSCTGIPQGLRPVEEFEVSRYLGTWHEIARLDHSFERGLTKVTARYTLRDDGGIDVLNRGYDERGDRWKEAKGKAYFTGSPRVGSLKVSFFGPFYGGYNVIALDRDEYSWSVVCGPSRNYLWILAREPRLDKTLLASLVRFAGEHGFETDRLIYPDPGGRR